MAYQTQCLILWQANAHEQASAEEGEAPSAPPSVQAHAGGAAALQRSPFQEDLLLSAGAWTWAVWREGSTAAPLLLSPFAPARYTAASWSPTRPGAQPQHSVLAQLFAGPLLLQSPQAGLSYRAVYPI